MGARPNPPRAGAHLVGSRVLSITYYNVGSSRRIPYRHDFESRDVQMWAMDDGSILIRHPSRRLWDHFTVEDAE